MKKKCEHAFSIYGKRCVLCKALRADTDYDTPKTKTVEVRAWADIGSHGHIFAFQAGPVADRYPGLLAVFEKPLKGLVPVTITYRVPK